MNISANFDKYIIRFQQPNCSQNMDKKKKIHFKAAALTSQELILRVQRCLVSLDIALFIHRNNFKYFPHFVEQLNSSFSQAALLYCITKRFPALTDRQNIDCVALSQQLKQSYTDINIKIMKKKDSFFYFLCIYFTKLAANFLEDTFVDILVQANLESQLYISLVYVTIGLQVSPKSYEVNHRKVISAPLTFQTKTYLVSKTDSIQSAMHKPSNKKINLFQTPSKKLQSKPTFQRNTHDFKSEPSSDVDLFKSALKQNLVVDVLPKIPQKKLKASEFDKMIRIGESKALQTENKNQLPRAESELIKPNNFLQSTQNSTSYEMFFQKNDQNICNMHKTVKISHRPQLIQTGCRKIKNLIDTSIHIDQSQNNQKACDSECSGKNWQEIVRNIKQNTVYTTKHNTKSLWVQNNNNQNEDTPTPATAVNEPGTFHYSEGQRSNNQTRKVTSNGLVMQPIHLRTDFYDEKEKAGEESEVYAFQRQKSQQYRVQRKIFDSQCNTRQIATAYSIFNAANINSSFVKFGPVHK